MLPSLDNPLDQVLASVDQLAPTARQILVTQILGQFGPDRPRPSARAQERLDRIVAHILPSMALALRLQFARSFGALDLDLPRTFAVIDQDAELTSEMSESPVCPDADTIRALGRHRRFGDMRALAGRDDLTADAAEVLSEAGDARTVRALATNPKAVFTRRTVERLVTRALHDCELQQQLCTRPELTTDDACRLVVTASDAVKLKLFETLDAEAAATVRRVAAAALPGKLRQLRRDRDSAMTTADVLEAVRAGSLSLTEAVMMLAATDRVIPAVEVMGTALGLDRETLVAALGRARMEPFEAMARALHLDEEIYGTLADALNRRWGKAPVDRRALTSRYRQVTDFAITTALKALGPRTGTPPVVLAAIA